MSKNVVTYQVKNNRKELIEKKKVFKSVAEACNFFQTIKSISVTKPVISGDPD